MKGGSQVNSFLLLQIRKTAWRLQVHPSAGWGEREAKALSRVGASEKATPKAKVLSGRTDPAASTSRQGEGGREGERGGRRGAPPPVRGPPAARRRPEG